MPGKKEEIDNMIYYIDFKKSIHENIYNIWMKTMMYGRCLILKKKRASTTITR